MYFSWTSRILYLFFCRWDSPSALAPTLGSPLLFTSNGCSPAALTSPPSELPPSTLALHPSAALSAKCSFGNKDNMQSPIYSDIIQSLKSHTCPMSLTFPFAPLFTRRFIDESIFLCARWKKRCNCRKNWDLTPISCFRASKRMGKNTVPHCI